MMVDLQLSPEQDFLLRAVRAFFTGDRELEPNRRLDWLFILQIARDHCVEMLLLQVLERTPAGFVPSEIRNALQRRALEILSQNLWLAAEAERLIAIGRQHKIPLISFKGPTLAVLAYGDVGFRVFDDLDFLIEPENVATFAELLASVGYQQKAPANALCDPYFIALEREAGFYHPQRGIVLDLQWKLAPTGSFDIPFAVLDKNARVVSVGGKEISTFAVEDLLLYLCVHGARHRWERLGWIVDITGLIQHHPELCWETVFAQAQRLKCVRVLFLGLLLAEKVGGVKPSKELTRRMSADTGAVALARHTLRDLFQPPSGLWAFHLYSVRAQDRIKKRLQYLARLLFAVRVNDWHCAPLSPAAKFLSSLIRPARLIKSSFIK